MGFLAGNTRFFTTSESTNTSPTLAWLIWPQKWLELEHFSTWEDMNLRRYQRCVRRLTGHRCRCDGAFSRGRRSCSSSPATRQSIRRFSPASSRRHIILSELGGLSAHSKLRSSSTPPTRRPLTPTVRRGSRTMQKSARK